MKNFFKKIKSYSFWVSFSAALIILLNALGNVFGFKIENQIVEDCIMSIAGLLVVFGIVSMNDKKPKDEQEETKQDEENAVLEEDENKNETDNENMNK